MLVSPHARHTDCITNLPIVNLFGTDENLIDTPGCTIPNIWAKHQTVEAKDCKNRCGIRGVFVKNLSYGNKIKFTINKKPMEIFFGANPYKCCSQFASLNVSDRANPNLV